MTLKLHACRKFVVTRSFRAGGWNAALSTERNTCAWDSQYEVASKSRRGCKSGAVAWHESAQQLCFPSNVFTGCDHQRSPLRVAVLLSGGVDSSLALALLRAAGHDVHAFYLQIWFHEDFRNFWEACPWEEDLQYAQQVCDQLSVPLSVVPLTNQYWERVVSHCVQEIKNGRTPNPDVLCNSRVKFGAFFEYLSKHDSGFDRVASGHYARVKRVLIDEDSPSEPRDHVETHCRDVSLCLTPDAVKDQTYFLANLSQDQLQKVLFPLGTLTKSEVRRLAKTANLPTMQRKDSQGICFLGKVKFNEFIKEHLGEWPGPIIEEETNEVLSLHDGFWFYTIGQRSGLNLGNQQNGPWYVVRKDPLMNAVYVSLNYFSEEKHRDSFICGSFNWLNGAVPPDVRDGCIQNSRETLFVKVRHGPNMYRVVHFELNDDGRSAFVQLPENDQGLAPGQYAVFYHAGVCLGCGVIQN